MQLIYQIVCANRRPICFVGLGAVIGYFCGHALMGALIPIGVICLIAIIT